MPTLLGRVPWPLFATSLFTNLLPAKDDRMSRKLPNLVASVLDLPPHVWALVLRDATLHDLFTVAHTCRALHQLVTSRRACACASATPTLGRGSDPNRRGLSAFWAHLLELRGPISLDAWLPHVRLGNLAHVALALHAGAEPHANDQEAISKASAHGHVALIDLLLSHPCVDPCACSQEAILHAIQHGHVAAVDRLLRDPRVDPTFNEQICVDLASYN